MNGVPVARQSRGTARPQPGESTSYKFRGTIQRMVLFAAYEVDSKAGSWRPVSTPPTKIPNAKAFGILLFTSYLFTITLTRIGGFDKVRSKKQSVRRNSIFRLLSALKGEGFSAR